jgi:hypothetical protein
LKQKQFIKRIAKVPGSQVHGRGKDNHCPIPVANEPSSTIGSASAGKDVSF